METSRRGLEDYRYQYATGWTLVKVHWNPTTRAAEAEAVLDMLKTFGTRVLLHVKRVDPPEEPTAEAKEAVYRSCAAAAAAVEERVQGNRGGGKDIRKP